MTKRKVEESVKYSDVGQPLEKLFHFRLRESTDHKDRGEFVSKHKKQRKISISRSKDRNEQKSSKERTVRRTK